MGSDLELFCAPERSAGLVYRQDDANYTAFVGAAWPRVGSLWSRSLGLAENSRPNEIVEIL